MSIATQQFDAAGQVPDEYDFSCEACGYSLAGIATDRCPECGRAFDVNALPFARVPWLHRRRIGLIKAYLSTVELVAFRPTKFTRELSRPTRISLADARAFRSLTLWIATASFAMVISALPVMAFASTAGSFTFSKASIVRFVFGLLFTVMGIAAFHLFIRVATDMPLFIWKRALSYRALAPIHCYACAPLGLLPLPGIALGCWLCILLHRFSILDIHFVFAASGTGILWLIWLWIIALLLMDGMHLSLGRQIILAFYLPTHWVMMLFISFGLFAISFAGVRAALIALSQ